MGRGDRAEPVVLIPRCHWIPCVVAVVLEKSLAVAVWVEGFAGAVGGLSCSLLLVIAMETRKTSLASTASGQ